MISPMEMSILNSLPQMNMLSQINTPGRAMNLTALQSQQGPTNPFQMPDLSMLNQLVNNLPPDPSNPLKPRPSMEILLARKKRTQKYWRGRNQRMIEDEKLYKMVDPVEDVLGQDEIMAHETLILNDPYVLVEKISNMISAAEPVITVIPQDPGMGDQAQKVKDFLYWWWEEVDSIWNSNLNNYLNRDEIYYLALRGWLCARLMLDPGDSEFPWRYDLVDPINVYPERGGKAPRWVFHIYRDSKINVLSDFGWSNDLLQRIEEQLDGIGDEQDIEVASYYDDVWHVMFLDEEEVWSAPHNYGIIPWQINTAFGPPTRRSDYGRASRSSTDITNVGFGLNRIGGKGDDYTRWIGVSIFEGIKEIYKKINKLASAVMTEAMKAPNPPIVIFTNEATGKAEGKVIETGIGSTSYLIQGQEDFKEVNYGFKPSELQPLMSMLIDARNRGALPAVMYGEGTNYLSGFAVSLLQAGSRDIILPLIKAHENFRMNVNRKILKITSELYPYPINMVETNPVTGGRERMTMITPDDIKIIGYKNKVKYNNIFPQDKKELAAIATALVKEKIIGLETARGPEFVGLQNPSLENKKVIHDLIYTDPDYIKASIPLSLIEVDPQGFLLYMEVQQQKLQEQQMQAEMMMQMAQQQQSMTGNNPKSPKPGGGGPSVPIKPQRFGAAKTGPAPRAGNAPF